jgi:hypothetical protein
MPGKILTPSRPLVYQQTSYAKFIPDKGEFMKCIREARLVLASLLLSSTVAHFGYAQVTLPKIDVRPGQPPSGTKSIDSKARDGIMPNCPDPAAIRIDIKLESRSSPTSGDFEIVGIARNVGRIRYAAASDSIINFWEIPSSGRRRIVGTRTFRNLEPNQEIRLSLNKVHLDVATEFFRSYMLEILHAPDATADCNSGNNRLTREGTDIRNRVVELLSGR